MDDGCYMDDHVAGPLRLLYPRKIGTYTRGYDDDDRKILPVCLPAMYVCMYCTSYLTFYILHKKYLLDPS
jgi:hypothetical protein